MEKLLVLLVLTASGLHAAEVDTPPLLAQASIQARFLDMAVLNRFFDASRLQSQGLVPEPAAARAAAALKPLPTYRKTLQALAADPEKTDRYDGLIRRNSERYRLNPRLVKAIVSAESEFSKGAVSPKGARGLMQVMPATAREMGVRGDLRTAENSVQAGTAYLNWLFRVAWRRFHLQGRAFRDAPQWVLQRIIAAYNAGPRFLTRTDLYRETRHYVRKVIVFYKSDVTVLRRR
ncbi:MAG: lytic transglycosylase domain-containing protein [Elusimicrobiota bacterium]